MEQLFEVLGPVVILVFIAIGKLLEIAFKGKEENNTPPRRRPAPSSQNRPEPESGQEDLSDVQERIRRLIMERAGIEEDAPQTKSKPPPPAPEPEPVFYEEPEPVVQDYFSPAPPPKPPISPTKPRPPDPALSSAILSRRRSSALRRKLGLNSTEDLKKAILQREILGPPLALRNEDQRDTW